MNMETTESILQIRNQLSDIESGIDQVAEFCRAHQLSNNIIHNVQVSLDEVLSNIIKYGYRDETEHTIQLHVRLLEDTLEIEVRDDGQQFDITGYPPPDVTKPLMEREKGGLGIYFVHRLMDKVEYQREGNENILTLRKQRTKV